ncbi:MAG TPA: DNA polymerase, partial [Candidatus Tumulicola sp.]
MLLDTYGLVYRAFFALPGLTTSKGVPINAAYGFTMMLNKIVADERPTHVIAAFDKGKPAHRTELYKEYKAQRETMPDELRSQFALVRRILDVFGIPIVEIEGQEADDVIATLARQAEEAGEQTLIVTGDLDLLQVVDERTTALVTRRGITELGRYDPDAVRARFGLEPSQLPDYRGLKGDPSDNLPGIPGVGEKTATKLLQAAGSLDALVANPSLAGTPKLQKLVEQYGDQACLCRTVSVVRRDLPLTLDWDESFYRAPEQSALYTLYSDLEFKSLVAKLQAPADLPLLDARTGLSGSYRSYAAAVDPPEFARLAGDICELLSGSSAAIALAGEHLGLSGATETGIDFPLDALAHDEVRAALQSLLDSNVAITAYDAKRVTRALAAHGLNVPAFADDAMIAAHLLDPGRGYADPQDAAAAILGAATEPNAAATADATLRMIDLERESLREREQLELYRDVELPLAPVLARMEAAGVAVDLGELAIVGREVESAAGRLQRHIFDFAGEEFNIGSPMQLGKILFEKLQIPSAKKGKTGWSTGVEVLQGLSREYPICALVLEWREVTKLKNTYIDVIGSSVDPSDG